MLVARRLGFHLLDSGAMYRVAALHILRSGLKDQPIERIVEAVTSMRARFDTSGDDGVRVLLDQDDVTLELRTEETGGMASEIASEPAIRSALLTTQHTMRQLPGLVADGRDMGTAVFPDAILKVFLTASAEERAARRQRQLNQQGKQVTLESLLQDIQARDSRDTNRTVSPLKPAADALIIDSTGVSINNVVDHILSVWHERR